jgi:hypothetical protein
MITVAAEPAAQVTEPVLVTLLVVTVELLAAADQAQRARAPS